MTIKLPQVRKELRKPFLRLLFGATLIGSIVVGPNLYGIATSGGRLAEDLQQAGGDSNIRVVLDFQPLAFHQAQLARYGVFSGRQDNTILLMGVSPNRLHELSTIYWIDRIEPLAPPS